MTRRHMPTAQHEAAHIVVGVACGLRLRCAALELLPGWEWSGYAWFHGNPDGRHREALALMYAAGVAWENGSYYARDDRKLLREVCSGRHAELAMIRAADAILCTRGAILAALARGDALETD
jgi:hypothetical protein